MSTTHKPEKRPVERNGQKAPLVRKDSKFGIQKDQKEKELYRPEFSYGETKKGQEKLWELMGSYIG